MEFINFDPTVDKYLAEYHTKMEYVHSSIAWTPSGILYFPLPPHTCIGPVGGGRAVHKFFGDYNDMALLNSDSMLALQRYVTEVRVNAPFYPEAATNATK